MASQRKIRELALQALYQIDARSGKDIEQLGALVQKGILQSTPGTGTSVPISPEVTRPYIEAERDDDLGPEAGHAAWLMAQGAWGAAKPCDELVLGLAPEWPPNRQPVIDRCILRLAYHEMVSGLTPAKVAVNEAVELAKRYSGEKSPAFVNGLLDKMMKLAPIPEGKQAVATEAPQARENPDAWLADALAEDASRNPAPNPGAADDVDKDNAAE